jgi:hypothetical protein
MTQCLPIPPTVQIDGKTTATGTVYDGGGGGHGSGLLLATMWVSSRARLGEGIRGELGALPAGGMSLCFGSLLDVSAKHG